MDMSTNGNLYKISIFGTILGTVLMARGAWKIIKSQDGGLEEALGGFFLSGVSKLYRLDCEMRERRPFHEFILKMDDEFSGMLSQNQDAYKTDRYNPTN